MSKVIMRIMLLLFILGTLPLIGCGRNIQSQNLQYKSFGPLSLNIGTRSGDFNIGPLKQNDKVVFSFKVTGAPVKCLVQNPKGTTIFVSRGGYSYLQRGGGHFISSISGNYKIHFVSSGLGTPSIITIDYRIYQSQ